LPRRRIPSLPKNPPHAAHRVRQVAWPALRDAITATFDEKDLKEGTAWAGHASDFFFATPRLRLSAPHD